MYISSRDNPKIKRLRKLYSSKKARESEGLFVIEGIRGCVDAAACALFHNSLKIAELYYVADSVEAYSKYLPTYYFDDIDGEKKFEITPEIAAKISDTEISQGVFIVAERVDKQFGVRCVRKDGRYIVLDNLQDPGNLGTMLRTSDAVGVDGVILTGNCVDLYNPKVVRSAVGSMPRLNIYIEKSCENALKILKNRGIRTIAAVVKDGIPITDYDFSGGCAVVVGNEGRGLAHESVRLCDDAVTIKMKGNIDSLNAAVAGTIFLWEMSGRE